MPDLGSKFECVQKNFGSVYLSVSRNLCGDFSDVSLDLFDIFSTIPKSDLIKKAKVVKV